MGKKYQSKEEVKKKIEKYYKDRYGKSKSDSKQNK
jgi:hypothetical protein